MNLIIIIFPGQQNALWSRTKILEKELNDKILEFNRLTESHDELQIKHNHLLIIYDAEVNKTNKLVSLGHNAHKSQGHDKDTQTINVTLDDAELGIGLLDDLKEKYSKEVTENRNLKTQLGKMKDDYARIRREFEEIKVAVDLMKVHVIEDLDRAKESLKTTVAEIEQKDLQIEKLDKQVAYVKLKNKEQHSEINQLNLSKKATLEQVKSVKEQNLQLTNELKEIKLELSKMEQINGQLNELNVKYQSELESLRSGKLKSDQLIEKLKQEVQETSTKINSLDAAYQGAVRELDTFKIEHLELTNKLKHAELQLSEVTEKARQLEIQAEESKTQIAKLETTSQNACKEVETVNSEKRLLITKLEDAKLEIGQMQFQINHLNSGYHDVLTKLQYAETTNTKLSQEVKVTLHDIAKKDFQLTRLEKDIQFQQEKLEEVKTENFRLQNELCDIKSELDRCRAVLQNQETQLIQLSSTNHELSSELLMVKREKEELTVDCGCLTKNVNTLEQANKRLKDKIAKITSNYTANESQLTLQNTLIQQLECSLHKCNEDLEKNKAERDNLKLELDKSQQIANSLLEGAKKQSFSKQEIVIEKLKRKNEELENRLKATLEDELKYQMELTNLEGRLKATQDELDEQSRKREVGVEVEVQTLEVENEIW